MIRVDRVYSPAAMRLFIEPLLEDHFREVGNTRVYDLAPDFAKYTAIDNANGLLMIAAFDDEDCIGYSINFLTPHVHYVNQNICYNDVLFVAKDYRESSAGGRLMRATLQEAKHLGAKVMQWHAKPNTALDEILSKRATLFEYAYTQTL